MGVNIENLRKVLLRVADLTLERTVKVCQIHEVSERDAPEIHPEGKSRDINTVKKVQHKSRKTELMPLSFYML